MRERADDMAFFVMTARISPTEYYALTGYEREALLRAYKQMNRKR